MVLVQLSVSLVLHGSIDKDPQMARKKEDKDKIIFSREEKTSETTVDLILPNRGARPPILRQTTGPGAPSEHTLSSRRIVIGRSKTADITVDSPELSRLHAKLERDGPECKCTDLDSVNGLYLNGVKVYSCVLRSGDTIQVGNVVFVYREDYGA